MNRIHLLYDQFEWRPTRWWWADHPQRLWHLEEIFMHIREYPGEQAWVRRDICEMLTGSYKPYFPRKEVGTEWWHDWEFFDVVPDHVVSWDYCVSHNALGIQNEMDTLHLIHPRKLCKPGTGIMAMYQQAVWEGFDTVYFLGIDGGFRHDEMTSSHFHPEYYDDSVRPTPEQAAGLNAIIQWQHELIQKHADEAGIIIRTLNGELTAHERADIKDVL